MGEILLQFWNLKKYFSFLQSYGCINILCHIFNFARNNQQQLVIFIVNKHFFDCLITNTKIWQIVHFSVCSKCPPVHHQLSRKPEVFSGSSIWLCWSSPVAAGPISTAELSWAHRCSPAWVEMTCSIQAYLPRHGSPEGWGQASSEAIHLYQWTHCCW